MMQRKIAAGSDIKFKNDQRDGPGIKFCKKKRLRHPSKCYDDSKYESKKFISELQSANDNLQKRKIIKRYLENKKLLESDPYEYNTFWKKRVLRHKTRNLTELTCANLELADTPKLTSNSKQPKSEGASLLPCSSGSENPASLKKKLCILTPNTHSNINENIHMHTLPRKENNSQRCNSCVCKSLIKGEYQKENISKAFKRTEAPKPCSKFVRNSNKNGQKCKAIPMHSCENTRNTLTSDSKDMLTKYLKVRCAAQSCKDEEEPANGTQLKERAACKCNQDKVYSRDRKTIGSKCQSTPLNEKASVTKPKTSIFRRFSKNKNKCDPCLTTSEIDPETSAELAAIQANDPMLPKSVNDPLLRLIVDKNTKKVINREEIIHGLGTRRNESGAVKQGRLAVKKRLIPPPVIELVINRNDAKILSACNIAEKVKKSGKSLGKKRIKDPNKAQACESTKPCSYQCTKGLQIGGPKTLRTSTNTGKKSAPMAVTEEMLECLTNTPPSPVRKQTCKCRTKKKKINPCTCGSHECQKLLEKRENSQRDTKESLNFEDKKLIEISKKHKQEQQKEGSKKTKQLWDPLDYECSLYVGSLRKKPCLWVHYMCPWFYPHCVNLIGLWRRFTDILLFILAVGVWSPCILCTELCRALMCCLL